jgi:hypothetical protein
MGVSDAISIMNYWRWLPPARAGVREMLVGHNTAYDRKVLLDQELPLELLLRCDPILQWHLVSTGHQLFLDPRIKIAHINETEISSIMRGYFHWNRVFAPTRAEVFRWSNHKRLLWILAAALIPPVRLVKQAIHILRFRPVLLGLFLRSLYVQVLAHTAAAAGQVIGLVIGIGEAETLFLHYELNQGRRVSDHQETPA